MEPELHPQAPTEEQLDAMLDRAAEGYISTAYLINEDLLDLLFDIAEEQVVTPEDREKARQLVSEPVSPEDQ